MCADCGCGLLEEQHGDDRHILWSQIKAAAEANESSPKEVAQNIMKMAEDQA